MSLPIAKLKSLILAKLQGVKVGAKVQKEVEI